MEPLAAGKVRLFLFYFLCIQTAVEKGTIIVCASERLSQFYNAASFCMLPGSANGSSYFASVDSSLNSQKVESHSSSGEERQMDPSKTAENLELNPLWEFIANADEGVMMTYQLPSR